jgi:hypothetical protein
MFRQIAEKVLRKKIYKKDYFLMGRLRIESSPDISLPPCILLRTEKRGLESEGSASKVLEELNRRWEENVFITSASAAS